VWDGRVVSEDLVRKRHLFNGGKSTGNMEKRGRRVEATDVGTTEQEGGLVIYMLRGVSKRVRTLRESDRMFG